MKEYIAHAVADLFPLMSGEQFKELVEDMRVNGQLDEATLHEGRILDGRNRYNACKELGIECRFKNWNGNGASVTAFVVSANLKRRHLTFDQRTAIAAELKPFFAAEAKEKQKKAGGDKVSPQAKKALGAPVPQAVRAPKAVELAATIMGVGGRSVSNFERVQKADPKLAAKVKTGEVKLRSAIQQVQPPKKPPSIANVLFKAFGELVDRIGSITEQYGSLRGMLDSKIWKDQDTGAFCGLVIGISDKFSKWKEEVEKYGQDHETEF